MKRQDAAKLDKATAKRLRTLSRRLAAVLDDVIDYTSLESPRSAYEVSLLRRANRWIDEARR